MPGGAKFVSCFACEATGDKVIKRATGDKVIKRLCRSTCAVF